jgi:glycosyltransferase involved in cell wall biosynthesis
MRIAYYVPRASYLESCPGGEKHTSGSGMFITNVLTSLRDRGHEVKIISRVDLRDFWLGRLPARRLLAEVALVRGEVKRFSPDAWLVYASSVQYPDLFGWWQHPKRYVLLGCEGSGESRVKAMPRPWRDLYTFAFRKSLKRADKVIAVRTMGELGGAIEHLRSWGVAEEKICFLPLAVKTWARLPSREEARRVLGLQQEGPVVLCVSRLSVRKRKDDTRPGKAESVLELIRAFASLPQNALLLLVGDGEGHRQVEDEAARLGLRERVLLAGEVEHSEIGWYYAACDFFAIPEKAESNRPYQALLEAQAVGRAILTMDTNLGHITTEAGRTGFLAKDFQEFQSHLLALAKDRSLSDEMGRAAAAFVARSFSMEIRAAQIEKLLLGSEEDSNVRYRIPDSQTGVLPAREMLTKNLP